MKEFVKQYGGLIVTVIAGLLIMNQGYAKFRAGMVSQGVVADSKKVEFAEPAVSYANPVLQIEDQVANVGEDFDPLQMVHAKDVDGTDLTNQVVITDLSGNAISGYPGAYQIKTDTSKAVWLSFSVKGKNGKKTSKIGTLLIDWRGHVDADDD